MVLQRRVPDDVPDDLDDVARNHVLRPLLPSVENVDLAQFKIGTVFQFIDVLQQSLASGPWGPPFVLTEKRI